MQQDDNNKSRKSKSDDIRDWQNEHGHPSNEYLQSLADANNLVKLKAIAADLDAEFGPNDSAEELIGAIRMATRNGPNTTT